MKTAVSLSDDLFKRAESAARKLGVSRSKLYANAIADFLERHQSSDVTAQLNRVYSRERARVDPLLHRAQVSSWESEEW
jgi:predicted transcriptional regulator